MSCSTTPAGDRWIQMCIRDSPKTVLYTLNHKDNLVLSTIGQSYQEDGVTAKVQFGVPGWFNDHKAGMTEQMTSLANLGCLGNFIGMLTDSRSFLSYTCLLYTSRCV